MALVANSPQTWTIGASSVAFALVKHSSPNTATSTRRLIFWLLLRKRVASSQGAGVTLPIISLHLLTQGDDARTNT